MNGLKLIWVVLLNFKFIVAVLTTPTLFSTNFQNDTTNYMGNFTETCSEEFTGYCMNGGYFVYQEEQQTVACECPDLYDGKRWGKLF